MQRPALGPAGSPWLWPLKGLFALALIFAVREARPLLAPLLVAIVLTFVLAPGVRWLRRRGVPELLGALLMVLALLAGTVPIAASVARPAAEWLEDAPDTLAQLMARFERLRAMVPGFSPPPPPAPPPAATRPTRGAAAAPAPAPTPPPADPIAERIATESVALTGVVLGQGFTFFVAAAATLILLYFLLASEHWMLSRVVEAVPRWRTRALLLGGVRMAQREIGRYLVALTLINGTAGAVTGVALWFIGLPNPTLWAAVVAVLCFVPYLGPLVLMGLLGVAGITTFDTPGQMMAPAAVFMLIHAIESNVVSPWLVGRRLSLSPISVFLAVMFWGWLWGIAGALIAVPTLIALRILSQRTRNLRLLRRFLEGDRRRPPSIRSLMRRPLPRPLAALRRGAGAVPVPPSEAVHVAQRRGVDALAVQTREGDLVPGPLQNHT